MSDVMFDTLMYSKKLREAGFSEKQAEIQAEAIKELIDDKLATKNDLKRIEERLMNRMQEMSYKLTIRMGGMLVTAVVILAAIIKF